MGSAAGTPWAEPASRQRLFDPIYWAAVRRGSEEVCASPYTEASSLVHHPVSFSPSIWRMSVMSCIVSIMPR